MQVLKYENKKIIHFIFLLTSLLNNLTPVNFTYFLLFNLSAKSNFSNQNQLLYFNYQLSHHRNNINCNQNSIILYDCK